MSQMTWEEMDGLLPDIWVGVEGGAGSRVTLTVTHLSLFFFFLCAQMKETHFYWLRQMVFWYNNIQMKIIWKHEHNIPSNTSFKLHNNELNSKTLSTETELPPYTMLCCASATFTVTQSQTLLECRVRCCKNWYWVCYIWRKQRPKEANEVLKRMFACLSK